MDRCAASVKIGKIRISRATFSKASTDASWNSNESMSEYRKSECEQRTWRATSDSRVLLI
jgi:hypothetical protein